jgi:methylated-DNA-[protein]-cysteine S-methyltransferase
MMAGRGGSIFDAGLGRCGIAWGDHGILGVHTTSSKTLFDVLLPVVPPRPLH